MANSSERGLFSSRLGFLMAATGSAVGLGNIWGFPTNAAQNGGAAFLLLYLLLAFALAWPALMAELLIGRHTRANMVDALRTLAPGPVSRAVASVTGFAGLATASLILAFYAIIAGWMLGHLLAPILEMLGQQSLANWFATDSLELNLLLCLVFSLANLGIIVAGVTDGIEKWSTWLMPALVLLLVVMIVYVLNQPGAMDGVRHFLVPDLERLARPGLAVSAMGQAFFALSLGVGTMLVYGSYISNDANIPRLSAGVALIDTGISILAGLLILPALFIAQAQGVMITAADGSLIAGPDLIFQVLPQLFESMGDGGLVLAALFFGLLTIAALTSAISMLESPVAYAIENTRLQRRGATWLVASLIFAASVVIIVHFDRLFGLVVSLTTEYSQPLLGMMLCIFAGWLWQRHHLLQEIRNGFPDVENHLFWKIWPGYVKFVCPVLIGGVFLYSLR